MYFLGKRNQGFLNAKDATLSVFQSFCTLDYPGPVPFSNSTNQSLDPVPRSSGRELREENLISLFCLVLVTAVVGEAFLIMKYIFVTTVWILIIHLA